MALLASSILVEARGLLNDPTGAIYPDAPMLVLANKVYKELQTKLSADGVGVVKEISAIVVLPTPQTVLSDGAGLPADLLYPLEVQERGVGAENFVGMSESEWEPDYVPSQTLNYWSWREDELKFPGATQNRDLKIKYVKSLGSIIEANSPILILNSQTWLAQRLAAVASVVIGSNPSRASLLSSDLVTIWDDLIATMIKRQQSIPVRRRRTRFRVA